MPFIIDDIAIAATEMSEVAAETAEIAGEVTESSEIIGDGIGESSLVNEKVIDAGESLNPSVSEPTEIIGDGVDETALESPESGIEQSNNVNDIQTDERGNIPLTESVDNTTLDDTGKPYIKDGELIPNNTYEINGGKYETDDKGRIIHAEANVEINNSPRSSLNNRKVDGLEPGDDKGHIVARILGGADSEGNLVAMDSKLNRGEYKSMELGAKRALEEGKEVQMTVDIEYDGESKRPKSFTVTLEIDGEITVKKFLNNKNE